MKKTYYATKDFNKYYKVKAVCDSDADVYFNNLFNAENYCSFCSEDGLNPYGLYVNRYYARKNAASDECTVKVDGGYTNVKYEKYRSWRKQK